MLDKGTDLVTDPAIVAKCFILAGRIFGEMGWVVEAMMDNAHFSGKSGAGFMRMATDGNHKIKGGWHIG